MVENMDTIDPQRPLTSHTHEQDTAQGPSEQPQHPLPAQQDQQYLILDAELDRLMDAKWHILNENPNAKNNKPPELVELNRKIEIARRRLHEYKKFGRVITSL